MLIAAIAALLIHRPPIYVHYMPWFSSQGKELGWHWRMNRTSEEVRNSGNVASHYHPLIGPYDELDPDVVELQVHWMKFAGFDGVIADWYGKEKVWDYPDVDARTELLFRIATKAGLRIGVMYEDQSVGNAIREHHLPADQKVPAAARAGSFLGSDWLKRSNWIHFSDRPAVFVFGPQAFGAQEWGAFRAGTGPIDLLTLHHLREGAQGAFDWPLPDPGLSATDAFQARAAAWPIKVSSAFPRFNDFYREGGQSGYAKIDDADGKTYRDTLRRGLGFGDAVQVATWNDWQEGTQIEPSREFGYRDLIATQEARKALDSSFAFQKEDLELPLKLYRCRKAGGDPASLDEVSNLLDQGRTAEARKLLARFERLLRVAQ